MYLRYRYRSKLGWFFWFGPIHVTVRRNLAILIDFLCWMRQTTRIESAILHVWGMDDNHFGTLP